MLGSRRQIIECHKFWRNYPDYNESENCTATTCFPLVKKMDKESIFLDKWLLCVHLHFFLQKVFFTLHRTNVLVRRPPFFLDYLLFCLKRVVFLGKNLILFGRWMIFMRPPAVEAEAMSLGTLALRPPRCTWICKHLYLWVLFFITFLGNMKVFGFHAAPGCANIFICGFCSLFFGDIGMLYLASTLHLDLQIFSY